MITTPKPCDDEQPAEMPRICRPLFNALVDVVLPLPHASMSLSISLAQADPATAKLLRDYLEARGDNVGRLFRGVLDALRPIVARQVGCGVLEEIEAGEIENHESEKIHHDAQEPSPAREEKYDAEKLPIESGNLGP